MSTAYGEKEVRIWIMGFGLALMLIGIALLASWGRNVFFIPAGFFLMVLGMGAFATALATSWWDRPPVPKIRCKQCYTLNYETAMRCRKCGNSMF